MVKLITVIRLVNVTKSYETFNYLNLRISEYTNKGGAFLMYAVIESCGKQYKVTEGDVVFFEKLDAKAGKKVSFD